MKYWTTALGPESMAEFQVQTNAHRVEVGRNRWVPPHGITGPVPGTGDQPPLAQKSMLDDEAEWSLSRSPQEAP